jgi:hypothetical protein
MTSPDLKPHVAPLPPGSEACACCAGVGTKTPRGVENRAGLSAISYRTGEYAEFRASLLARLSSAAFPALARLRTRDADDFTIGLIDAFACSADIFTFYQERIADESYLRTATERVSLKELGDLIGYRLRPGVAAETALAFTLETPPVAPPTLAPEPGSFVTGVPASLRLEPGLKVQSVPGPGEKPQTFETVEALDEARPSWNAIRPWLSEVRRPGRGDTFTYLAGVRSDLKPGHALVFLGDEFLENQQRNEWDFRLVDTVEADSERNRTLVRWKRGLGSLTPFANPTSQKPQVHVLRKRAAPFGHNAPMWTSMGRAFRRDYPDGKKADGTLRDDWPSFVLSPAGSTSDGGHLDLDATYGEVRNKSYVVLAKGGFNYASEPSPSGTYVELYEVSNVAEVSRAEFALSAKVTRARLSGENYQRFASSVRETTAFVQSEPLEFAEYPVNTAVFNDRVPVNVSAQGLLPGRRLVIRGRRVSDGASVVVNARLVQAHPLSATRAELEISPPLSAPLVRDSVVVHANVALASHGESVSQILGSGNANRAFQRFELKQLPLTHRAADSELGVAAELTVRVADIAWQKRPTLFGAEPNERAYVLETDERGREFVVFGDGLNGARPPSGSNNVRAQYRKGLGAEGNVTAEKLTQLMSRPLGLKGVSNPLSAEGGSDPEPADAARRSMPLATRTLGRTVSLLDYEDFARAYSGIAKAQAQVLALHGGPTVVITVAAPAGAPLTPNGPVWQNLLLALKRSGDPHVAVQLLAYRPSSFRIGLKVKCDPSYEKNALLAAVETRLRARYCFDQRELGEPVHASEILSVAQAVPGVVAVDITRLYGGTQPQAQTTASKQVRLLAARMRVIGGEAAAAELLTLSEAPFDLLEEMA